MGGMTKSIGSMVADVGKIAGGNIKMPKEIDSLKGVMDKAGVDQKAFSDALKTISKQGASMEKSAKTVDTALAAALKIVAKDSFGLDEKSADGKKKLDTIRKLMTTQLTSMQKDIDKEMTSFSKLDGVVADASKGSSLG